MLPALKKRVNKKRYGVIGMFIPWKKVSVISPLVMLHFYRKNKQLTRK